jgi:outer membrane protein insertion porin family
MRFGFAFFLSLVIICSGFAQQSDEWYQDKPIKDIVFSGLQYVSSSELQGIVEPFIGRNFNDDVFWEIQGRLYALEYFEVISPSAVPADISGSEVILRFSVTERPTVSRITFAGNNRLRRNELLGVVSLKVNDVVNQVKLRVDEQAIIYKYLEKGFPDIRVRSETQTGSDSTITVTFFIEEGEKITIKDFRFEGNATFSDRALRGQLSLKAKGLLNDGAFQEAKLIADAAAVIQYYHDRGYIDADMIDVTREVAPDEKGNHNMTITFKIFEGRMYSFGGVSFAGNQIFSGEQLSRLVLSKAGDTVNARRVEADLQRVADLYYENGYIFNTIGREEIRDTENGVISYQIHIVERGRAHIEHILIQGNTKTKTPVILREIPLEPGDVFSKTKVMDGLRNLYNLQYFSVVAPDTPTGSEDSLMDLVFVVEEQPTMDLQFGLTFSATSNPKDIPISLQLKWNDRNLRGTGNALGAQLDVATDTINVGLTYDQAWLFGLPLSGGFDLSLQRSSREAAMNNTAPFFYGDEPGAYPDGFKSYEEYAAANKNPGEAFLLDYVQWYVSLGFSTGYRWATPLGNLSLGGGLRTGFVVNTYDADLYRPFDPILREKNNKPTMANSLWTSLALDQRDIFYDPSRGYYGIQRLGLYGVVPGEQEYYVRSDTKAEYYHTLLNSPITDNYNFRMIFGIHTGLSFLMKQGGRDLLISSANQLAVDGMFNGRGWNGEYGNKGLALWENRAELRYPLVPGVLAWDFFFDAAGVKPSPKDFFTDLGGDDGTVPGRHTSFMRFSLGGAIRFTIPQFPFRFGFAKRFKVQDGVVQWQKGGLWGGDSPTGGLDFVMSMSVSSY